MPSSTSSFLQLVVFPVRSSFNLITSTRFPVLAGFFGLQGGGEGVEGLSLS